MATRSSLSLDTKLSFSHSLSGFYHEKTCRGASVGSGLLIDRNKYEIIFPISSRNRNCSLRRTRKKNFFFLLEEEFICCLFHSLPTAFHCLSHLI